MSSAVFPGFSSLHNSFRVQLHEVGHRQQESHTPKEAAWRSSLLRHVQSGKSIAAFCRDESMSTDSFHIFRAKLAAAGLITALPAKPVMFIDLGAVKDMAGVTPMTHPPALASTLTAGIDVRIGLGGGVVLTITRR